MGTVIASQRFPQIVRPVRILGLAGLLRCKSSFSQIAVEQTGSEFVSDDRLHRGPADIQLAAVVVCRPVDRFSPYLRLEDWRDGLCPVLQAALDPTKLWSIQSGHLNHGDSNFALVVDQFAAEGICEPGDGMFGSAVCGLQRDAAVG